MIGHNKLHLNQSQMQQAMEHYLKNVLLKDEGFTVTGVQENSNTGFFEISLGGNDAKEETEE